MINTNLKKRIFTSILLLAIIFLIFSFNMILTFSLIVFGVLSLLEFFNLTSKIFKKKIYSLFFNTFFVIYVSLYCFIFFLFSNFFEFKIMLFTILLSCASSDIGGFVFGKLFKGPKLTNISPNKTYAGSLGSIIFTILVFLGLTYYFTKDLDFTIIIIPIIISIACQIGDLFFSYLKRKAKLEDTGDILPGHGGLLDRIDGIFLGIPIGFIALILFY